MIQTSIIAGLSFSLLSSIYSPTTTTICTPTDQEYCILEEGYNESAKVASMYGEPFATIDTSNPTPSEEPIGPQRPEPPKTYTAYFPTDETDHPLDAQKIMDLINDYRQKQGLTPFQSHPELCQIAIDRAPELSQEIFGSLPMHHGFKNRQFAYWITENMIHQPTEEAAVNWWLNSYIHRKAILSENHTYSCGACQGNSCAQLFSSFIPKQSQ